MSYDPKICEELRQKKHALTWGEIFEWNYDYYIKIMLKFAESIGRERVVEMIKTAVAEGFPPNQNPDPNFNFREWMAQGNEASRSMMAWETVEDSDTVHEIKATKCLWQDIFCRMGAGDIGYATICHGDFFSCKARHPKITLYRTKTLMEGHDCCNHRWVYEM